MVRRRNKAAYVFLAPFLILFAGFLLFPIIYTFGMSLFASRGLTSIFVGWNNYALAFHDGDFWFSIVRMIYFGVIQVTVMLLLALLLALLLDSPLAHAQGFYRLLYFLTYAVPGVVGAIIWAYLYSPNTGPLQGIVNISGLMLGSLK